MTKKPPKLPDLYKIPATDLEQYRDSWKDHVSPFENFGRVDFDALISLFRDLNKPEQRILLSMMKRMGARNMLILTRSHLRAWLITDWESAPELNHISTSLQGLVEKQAIKIIQRIEGQEDTITCCVTPKVFFKGKDKYHTGLLAEWIHNEITLPGRRSRNTLS